MASSYQTVIRKAFQDGGLLDALLALQKRDGVIPHDQHPGQVCVREPDLLPDLRIRRGKRLGTRDVGVKGHLRYDKKRQIP